MITYEERLNQNRRWALMEGSTHFDRSNAVWKTLRKLIDRLNDLKIAFVVAGDLAMFLHGYRRFTESIEVLTTPLDLERILEHLNGPDYVLPDKADKNKLRGCAAVTWVGNGCGK
jgi:hypothetical protein